MTLSTADEARLREKHPVLAEVIDSDRAIEAMRRTNVIDFDALKLRRDRVRAAGRCYGHQLRGDGDRHA